MEQTLKKIRISKGYSIQQVAEIIGMDFTTYSIYEAGGKPFDSMRIGAFLKLSALFGISCEDLLKLGGKRL